MEHTAGHRWSVRVLLVIGTVLAVLSIFAIWANRQLFNADNWANTSTAILAEPAVQTQLSNYLVDQLYANVDVAGELRAAAPPRLAPLAGPIAGALRNAAETVTKKVLGRPRIQEAWRTANRFTAQQFINIAKGDSKLVTTKGNAVVPNLRQLVLDLVQRLGLPGTLAGKVPESAGALTILRADQVSLIQNGGNAIRGLAVLLPALMLVCFAAAVALAAGRRHRILLWVGIDLVLAGILAIIGRNVMGGQVVDSLTNTDAAKPAAQAVWTVGTQLLHDVSQACIVLGIPVILGALLAGGSRPAVAARRLMAPTMRNSPAIVYGVEAVIVLLVIWWGPIPATRNVVPMLVLIVLFTIGVEALRRQTAKEFPPEAEQAERAALVDRARRAAQSVAGRGTFATRTGTSDGAATVRTPDPLLDRLERLEALHDRGVLTDAEFESQKSAALSA